MITKQEITNLKTKIKISEIKADLNGWSEYLQQMSNSLSSLVDYTNEPLTLISIILVLQTYGYEIEYE